MRRTLVAVWQGKLDSQKALELLRLQLSRAGPIDKKEEEKILVVLEGLREKTLIVNEAEEEICAIMEIDQKEFCQT